MSRRRTAQAPLRAPSLASTTSELRHSLAGIAETLLFSKHSERVRHAATALHAFYASLTGIGGANDAASTSSIDLSCGKALAPRDAANCVLDAARTSAYLRGIYAAIRMALARFAIRPVEIVYAGCGPFAALAVPLTTKFDADEIRFTLIDVHARSLNCAHDIFEAMNLSDFVRGYVQTDAATYVHADRPFQILIVESMLAALQQEPQVAITLNLAAQLCAGGILVPECIRVDAGLCEPATEFGKWAHGTGGEPSGVDLGTVFELTAATARARADGGEIDFPAVAVTIPTTAFPAQHLALRTHVAVFDEIELDEYDSGLTQRVILHGLGRPGAGTRVSIRYVMGRDPGFRCGVNPPLTLPSPSPAAGTSEFCPLRSSAAR